MFHMGITVARNTHMYYCQTHSSTVYSLLDIQNDTDYTSCATVTVIEGEDNNDTCFGEL